ncbi:MAG: cobalamin-binding protein [Hyphomicrobium sp.]
MRGQRIISFLPSATEMICALGLTDRLMGITHECDYPSDIKNKPIVVHGILPLEHMSQSDIDLSVSERLKQGLSLYQVDEALIKKIAPDLIVTQDLCQVCAPSGNEVTQLLKELTSKPEVLSLTPKSLHEIFENIQAIAKATDSLLEATKLIASAVARLEKLSALTKKIPSRPRVFCLEWVDPVYCSGHWVPEMVEIAGGEDKLGRKGADSVRIAWEDVLKWQPEVLIIMPCGYSLKKATEVAQQLSTYQGWRDLPAVREKRAYVVDANSYFARPGPRVVEGTELLAHLIHPKDCHWTGAKEAFAPLKN